MTLVVFGKKKSTTTRYGGFEAENGKVWMTYPGSRILDRGFAAFKGEM